jgi:hypothetical protein
VGEEVAAAAQASRDERLDALLESLAQGQPPKKVGFFAFFADPISTG